MSSARERALALVGLLVGGVLAYLGGTQPWWRAVGGDGLDVGFSGNDSTGGISQALALVLLAGGLLMLALRARGRQVLALLLAAAGVATAVVGALRLRPTSNAIQAQVRTVSLVDQFSLHATAWPWVYAGAGLLTVAAALIVVLRARRWPRRPDRFARRPDGSAAIDASADPADVWKAQDAGIDPTAPDVRSASPGDTMGGTEPLPLSDRAGEETRNR